MCSSLLLLLLQVCGEVGGRLLLWGAVGVGLSVFADFLTPPPVSQVPLRPGGPRKQGHHPGHLLHQEDGSRQSQGERQGCRCGNPLVLPAGGRHSGGHRGNRYVSNLWPSDLAFLLLYCKIMVVLFPWSRPWRHRVRLPTGGGGAEGAGRHPRRLRLAGQVRRPLHLWQRRPEEGHHQPAVRRLQEKVRAAPVLKT